MYCVTVNFRVAPDRAAEFHRRVRQQASASLKHEPGCRVFEVWRASERPDAIWLYEVYASQGAFDDHLKSAHFLAFDRETKAMAIDKQVTIWDRHG